MNTKSHSQIMAVVSGKTLRGYGIELRPVGQSDLKALRCWRNSPRIRKNMVDTSFITEHDQQRWFETIKYKPDEVNWVVWCKDIPTGHLVIKCEEKSDLEFHATGGMYVGDSDVRHGLLGYAMQMLMLDIVFNQLSLPEFSGPVRKSNTPVLKMLDHLGYSIKAQSDDFMMAIMRSSDFESTKKRFVRFFADARCDLVS